MLISITSGDENFPTGTSKFHAFFVPTRQHPGKEAHIGQMAKGFNPSVPVGLHSKQYFPAMIGRPPVLGGWVQGSYEVPEGVVLKLFAHKKGSVQGQSLPPITATMYIQMRAGANLERVSFDTLQHPQGQFAAVHIEGRFDILTTAQMGQLGISISPQAIQLLDRRKIDRLFRVQTLDRAVQQRVEVKTTVVKNSEGKAVAVSKAKAKRAVRL